MFNLFFNKAKIQIETFLDKYDLSHKFFSLNRRMLARGAFVGVYIAMIPMPMQMGAVILLTFLGRFNLPLALLMCWLTNPFTMPFVYYLEYATGSFLLGMETENIEISTQWFLENFENIILPLYTGAMFYSLVLSTLAYQFVLRFCVQLKCRRAFKR